MSLAHPNLKVFLAVGFLSCVSSIVGRDPISLQRLSLSAQKKRLLNNLETSIPEQIENNDVSIDKQNIIDFGERILAFVCSKVSLNFTLTAPDVDEKKEASLSIKRFT